MKIRNTQYKDLNQLLDIFANARSYMKKNGNINQWSDNYPSKELLINDISEGNSYVCLNDGEKIVGTFYFKQGIDITYNSIYEGEWLNDEPYAVIHRLAGTAGNRGIADFAISCSFERCKNIRIDTHKDNLILQNILKRNGFSYCGKIYLLSGAERLAFHKELKSR